MAGRRTLDVRDDLVQPQTLACVIAETYDKWKMARATKETAMQEVRDYIFAVDTTTTTNNKLPWKNKTTRPKLTQIRDNLHANYMAALFPNDDWFKWDAGDQNAADIDKAKAITTYMKHKLRQSKFEETVSRFVLDFIDTGNVFGDCEYVVENFKDKAGKTVTGYVGPRAYRISAYDVVFDISADTFEQAPKIRRTLLTLADIKKKMATDPAWANVPPDTFDRILKNRQQVMSYQMSDLKKSEGLIADGFSSIQFYYSTGLVEVLEFFGDLTNIEEGQVYDNHVITVIDRAYVVRNEPIDTWTGQSTLQHCGWRLRSDNLWAMGPLDNLVGLQYRIDHLENMKADVFDLIAYPVFKVKGYVEDFEYAPLEKIFMEQDSDVEPIAPDATALNADLQIQELEQQMEEMAGAPKNAMGIRTPGEKTKFEVQTLDNAASRMFQQKITYFEKNFLEPMLNSMLELARRNIDQVEMVKYVDDDLGIEKFLEVTKADLEAKGRLTPIGARHFAAQAQLVQNLTTLSGTGIYQDPAVNVHMSGLRLAKLLEDNLGLSQYRIVEPNIRIIENAESSGLAATAADQTQANAMTPSMTEEDLPIETEDEVPA